MSSKIIAIDGPAASGKSTVAKRVAAGLGYLYVDSGALYRGVTWHALRSDVDTRDAAAVGRLLPDFPIHFSTSAGAVVFTIDGMDPGMALRSETVNSHVSGVAATPEVRNQVNVWLRDMTRFGNLVVEGRDIGTAVFPSSEFKFYLDASPEERARRRYAEIAEKKDGLSKTDIGESLRKRDTIDRNRKKDPLRVAQDAVVIDSTGMGVDDVVTFVLDRVRQTKGDT
jgi:cytidylate kinase